MTGKKSNSQKSASNSNLHKDHEAIAQVVKSILTETNILQDTVNIQQQQKEISCDESAGKLLHDFKSNEQLLDSLVFKVSEYILNNESFKQIVCDSLSLELNNKLGKMEKEIDSINKKNEKLEILIESQEQYSRRNCLLIHGLPSEYKEDTDQIAINFFQTYLGIDVTRRDLDRSHRLGKQNSPIIVKFVNHNLKAKVFSCKRKLKGKNVFLTESLTSKRISLIKKLHNLQEAGKVKSFWSYDVIPANPMEANDLNRACLACEMMQQMPQFQTLWKDFESKAQFMTYHMEKVKLWLELVKNYFRPEQTWHFLLNQEATKPYFPLLMERIKLDRNIPSKSVHPHEDQVFSWTQHCNVWDVKVVILGQSPYPNSAHAHGLAFSVPTGVQLPQSLQIIYKELIKEGFKPPPHGNLTGWAKQGVLLLNTVSTYCKDISDTSQTNEHQSIGWQNFTQAMISWIAHNLRGIVFLLWGNEAKAYANLIKPLAHRRHYILTATIPCNIWANTPFSNHPTHLFPEFYHPNYIPQSGLGFYGCNHFHNTNAILDFEGKEGIN